MFLYQTNTKDKRWGFLTLWQNFLVSYQNDEHVSLLQGAELDVIPDMIMAGSFKHVGEYRQIFH